MRPRPPEWDKLREEFFAHLRGEDPWKAEREEYQRQLAEVRRKLAAGYGCTCGVDTGGCQGLASCPAPDPDF